jgi:hypothetical protein
MGYIGGISTLETADDYRINLTHNITDELDDQVFCSRSEVGRDGVRKRSRVLSNTKLIIIIIGFKTAIQRELDNFVKEISNADFNIRTLTKGAFTKARAKLNPWAFQRLNQVATDTFYNGAKYKIWHKKRVMAVDGTRLGLPNHPSIIEEFGQHEFGPKADSKRSLAMGSILYDVLNQISLDAQLAPYNSSERDLLLLHLEHLKQGDLLLLDRGYACFWLLFLLKAKKVDFCIRLKEQWWLDVKDFSESGEKERLVTFDLPLKDRNKLIDHPEFQDTTIICRLVKVELEGGEKEILCTSLLNQEEYKHAEFKELYHLRWNIEEAYKLLKSRIEVEQFSGKTALAVRQDFYAKVFLMTLTAAYAHPIEEKVIAEFKADQNRKHDQKINRTNALATARSILTPLFLKRIVRESIDAFDDIIYKTREIIRPNRSNQRKNKPKKPTNMNYKPL